MPFLKKIYRRYFVSNYNAPYLVYKTLGLKKHNRKFLSQFLKNKLIYKYGIHLGLTASIGENLKLPHPLSIVIGEGVRIGANCTIYHNVTLGAKHTTHGQEYSYPTIKDNVIIYTDVIILGDVTVGENTIIGAGSLVKSDLEPNSVYAGNPLKKIK